MPYPPEASSNPPLDIPPDVPPDVPPDTPPDAPPKPKFRLPTLGESLRATAALLRSERPDFPFHRPRGIGDLANMVLDVLLWLPKLAVHLVLYACRYLRASVRYAVEGATPLWRAFLIRPYSWTGFYLLLGGMAYGGVRLMSRGSMGASLGGFVLLLAPIAWGITLGWVAANALHWCCFFSRWTFVALEVLCVLGMAVAALGYPIALIASALLPLGMLAGRMLLCHTTLESFSPAAIVDYFQQRDLRRELREKGVHAQATVTYVAPVGHRRFFVEMECVHPAVREKLPLCTVSGTAPEIGQQVHVVLHPTETEVYKVYLTTRVPRVRIRKNDLWRNRD